MQKKRPKLPSSQDLALPPIEVKLVLEPRGSTAARLRPHWPTIISAIENNVTHREIVAQLEKAGLKLPMKTFHSELYRYRKSLKARSE